MSMETILSTVYLDVYDHDTSPTTIKAIALDSQTRFVQAYLQKFGELYQPDLNATVNLIALRPDKVGVEGAGEIVMLEESSGEDDAIYGVKAEITQAMIAVEGTVLLQFRLTVDDEVLRTEIFKINNGKALDGSTSEWADEYQGYNLDELVEKVDFIGEVIRRVVIGDISLDQAILETHAYIDHRLSVHDNAIYINT